MVSWTQLRYLSHGGRVTSPPRKTTRRPWRVRKYWSDVDERLKVPSEGSKNQTAALMECRSRFCPGRAMCPWRAKRNAGSKVLGRTSTSCLMVLRYWLWQFRRSTNCRLAKDRGLALLSRHSLKLTVSGKVRAILEFFEEW